MPRTEVFNRESVLSEARNVFWKKGYNGTSMQDLVDAMGLNRSSIYNSFGSKMELYELTLKNYQNESRELFDRARERAANALETIGLIFVFIVQDIMTDSDEKGCMIINCSTEMGNQNDALQQWLLGNKECLVAVFQELVEEGQKERVIRTDKDSLNLAYYLLSSFQGLRVSGMLIKDQKILKGIIANTLSTLK